MREGSSFLSCVCICWQAPASGVDIFTAGSGPIADPPPISAAAATSQNLQDLIGFSSVSRQMTAGGSSFMVPAAVPALVPRQSCPSSPSLLQHPMPGSPALSHAKARDLGSAPSSPLFHFLSPSHPPLHSSPGRAPDISLSNVHVPLEAIRPSENRAWLVPYIMLQNNSAVLIGFFHLLSGKVLPVTAYDKDGVRMLLNFASECPAGRPDVLVMVVSLLNTAPLAVHNVQLQAAVPKVEMLCFLVLNSLFVVKVSFEYTKRSKSLPHPFKSHQSMKVKLQPPSATELAAFNPILPPASITQIMLLANPTKVRRMM